MSEPSHSDSSHDSNRSSKASVLASKAAADAPVRSTYYEKEVWRSIYGYLIGPALIAAAALAVFTIMSVLSTEAVTPRDLVHSMTEGGKHRRWQAAFALSRYLQPSVRDNPDGTQREETSVEYLTKLRDVRILLPDLLQIFSDAKRADPQVRRYLAWAFSYLRDPRALPVLYRALEEETDVQFLNYAVLAIGDTLAAEGKKGVSIKTEQIDKLLVLADHQDEALRATVFFVLGNINNVSPHAQLLAKLVSGLQDALPSVRWNAAFGLARTGDDLAVPLLLEILERGPLYHAAGPEPQKLRNIFLNAVRSAGRIASSKLDERLSIIAKSDSNLAARDAAIKLMKNRPVVTIKNGQNSQENAEARETQNR